MRAPQIRPAFISFSSRSCQDGERTNFFQPFSSSSTTLFSDNFWFTVKFQSDIFSKIYGTNNCLAYIKALPPPQITLARSDGVQTTAPFPSHPTWGPGIPIAWSPPLEHTLPLCSHCYFKEASTPKMTPIHMHYQNVSTAVHCKTVYLRCNLYTIMRMCFCKKPKLSFLLECKPYVETGESTLCTVSLFPLWRRRTTAPR